MKHIIISFIFLLIGNIISYSQIIDETFHEPLVIRPAKVVCIKSLQGGKLLIGGNIVFYKNRKVNNLIRLNADGSIDEAFNFVKSGNFIVTKIALLKNGDIVIITQDYDPINDSYSTKSSLLELGSEGFIKKSVDSLISVNAVAIQDDDKILVCGQKDPDKGYLYRYNADLSPDFEFNSKVSFNNHLSDVKVFNNKLIVAGEFSIVNGTAQNDIVRLNLDGTVDLSFSTGLGTTDFIGSITIQNDGKILLGKTFINNFNGKTDYKGLIRLNVDGSVDEEFKCPDLLSPTSEIYVRDTLIYFAATLSNTFDSKVRLIRLKLNSDLDIDFEPIKIDGFGFVFFDFCSNESEKTIILNNSKTYGNIYGLSKYDFQGKLIREFIPEISRYGVIRTGEYFGDKLIIAGDFIKVNDKETFGIARINKDGTFDPSFIQTKNRGVVLQLQVLDDTSMFVSTGKEFFKLNTKAEIQSGFNFVPFKTLYQVLKFIVLPNNKIIVADANNVFRLNADGSEDNSFDIGKGIDRVSSAFDFDIQSDNIIYGSNFSQYNGVPVNRLVRLSPNALVDQTFNIGSGPDNTVSLIKVLKNGEILVGGYFFKFNDIEIPYGFVKLTKDGSIDPVFLNNQKLEPFWSVHRMDAKVSQLDSFIYIKGANNIAVININGKVERSFNIPFIISQINDIVAFKDSSSSGKKVGKIYGTIPKSYLYAFGSFKKDGSIEPSSIIKLNIENSATGMKNDIKLYNYKDDFEIYPNPIHDHLSILCKEYYNKLEIKVYDLSGRKYNKSIRFNIVENSTITIPFQEYKSGVYLVEIIPENGSSFFKKVVKK